MSTLPQRLAALEPDRPYRTLADRAFLVLRQAILTGVLEPGERLPHDELSDALRTSAVPIREALRTLDDAGLVDTVPHRGARVTPLSLVDLYEIYTARAELEGLAAAHAARHFDDATADAARRALERHIAGYRRGDVGATFAAHTDLHFTIYRAAGSRWLMRLITPLWESAERYRYALPPSYRRRLEERRAEHEEIVAACAAHDAARAEKALRDHLATTMHRIEARIGDGDPFAVAGSS